MSNHNLLLSGVITFPEGFHVAGFGEKLPGPENITAQMKKRLAIEMEREDDDANGTIIRTPSIPIIPGNSVRGKLRRSIALLIKKKLVERGLTVSRDGYYAMTVGSATAGKASKGRVLISKYHRLKSHPFAGLLSVDSDYPGSLITYDLVPMIQPCVDVGLIPDEYAMQVSRFSPTQLLERRTYLKRDDLLSMADPLAPEVVENHTEVFNSSQIDVLENTLKRKAQKKAAKDGEKLAAGEEKAKKTDHNNIYAIEQTISGTKMFWRMAAKGINDAQIGFLLMGVQEMIACYRFGGLGRLGLGEASGTLHAKIDGELYADAVMLDRTMASLGRSVEPFVASGNMALEQIEGGKQWDMLIADVESAIAEEVA